MLPSSSNEEIQVHTKVPLEVAVETCSDWGLGEVPADPTQYASATSSTTRLADEGVLVPYAHKSTLLLIRGLHYGQYVTPCHRRQLQSDIVK